MDARVITFIFALRILNALTLATFFQPDEYFQALEPAFEDVYGYGFRTWEWSHGLRNALIPYIYGNLFRVADLVGLDILVAAKLFQGCAAAMGDIYTYKLARKLGFSKRVAQYALIASLGSAFQWFCSTRSFSNTFEMVASTAALTQWPYNERELRKPHGWRNFIVASVFAHVAIILRPTNALMWLLLGSRLLIGIGSVKYAGLATVLSLLIAVGIHSANYLLDCHYYGRQVFPLLSFITTNIGEQASHYYGVMPWHFYLTSAMPVLTIAFLPLAVCGLYQLGYSSLVTQIVAIQVAVYTLLAHKEIRFIYFLLPFLHIAVATAASRWPRCFTAALLANAPVALYASYVHQRGVMDVMEFIRHTPEISEVSFLMPCHSTPWRSHMRRPELAATFLTCDPPVTIPQSQRELYVDEADQFYNDPERFLLEHPEKLAGTIVVFDAAFQSLGHILERENYQEYARFFNSHVHDDARRRGDVVVLTRT